VEDHLIFRLGLISWLNEQSGLTVCGEVGTRAEARRAVAMLQPDLVLLDLSLQDGDGVTLLSDLPKLSARARAIVLSRADELTHAYRALRAGAHGYVMKSESTEVLLTAIVTVLQGGTHLSPRVQADLQRNPLPEPTQLKPLLARLSDRELQVFELLGDGLGAGEIARRSGSVPDLEAIVALEKCFSPGIADLRRRVPGTCGPPILPKLVVR
jgi:DNA-binding NarL/FixJ family response regulator